MPMPSCASSRGRTARLSSVSAKPSPAPCGAGHLTVNASRKSSLDVRTKLAALEQLVHPAVREARERFVAQHGNAPALLFEIPLLFETARREGVRRACRGLRACGLQRARVLERTGMTKASSTSILARQMPDEEKRARADFVVDTGVDLSTTERQVRDILDCLGLRAGG